MNNLTVGQLLKFIEKYNIPMDAEVRYQRIEDYYFREGSSWRENSILKPDEKDIGTSQFVASHSTIKYLDDENLYITAHY